MTCPQARQIACGVLARPDVGVRDLLLAQVASPGVLYGVTLGSGIASNGTVFQIIPWLY